MRALLLAGIAYASLFVMGASNSAKAQFAVICPTCASEFAQVALWAKQAADMAAQLDAARQRYMMLVNTYNAIAHATDISGVTSALGGVTGTYMPEASETLSLLGSASHMLSGGQGHMDANRLFSYESAGLLNRSSGWFGRQASEMERRERVTGNVRALAEAGIRDAQARIQELDAARARILASRTGTETAAVQAALQAIQMNMQLHQTQIQNMQMLLASENRIDSQRQEQMQIWGAATWADATRNAVAGLFGGR